MLPRSTALPITPREWEVLDLLAQGFSQPEVAERLIVSVNTVHSHVGHVRAKVQARNSLQAVCVLLLSQMSCGSGPTGDLTLQNHSTRL